MKREYLNRRELQFKQILKTLRPATPEEIIKTGAWGLCMVVPATREMVAALLHRFYLLPKEG